MDGWSIRARRLGMGLSRNGLAQMLGVSETNLTQWERGKRPIPDPVRLHMELCELEDLHDELIDRACELIEHSSAVRDTPTVRVHVYGSNAVYWQSDVWARDRGIMSEMHMSAVAYACRIMREEHGIECEIVAR